MIKIIRLWGFMSVTKANYNKRIDRLDRLLLSVTSLLGIVFGLSQLINQTSLESIIFFIPFIFLIWILPVSIGYIGGGIVYDLLIERFRGWVYLIGGLLAYVIFSGAYYFRLKRGISLLDRDYVIILFLLVVMLLLVRSLQKKFFRFFNHKITDVEYVVLRKTYVNILFIGVTAIYYLVITNQILQNLNILSDVLTRPNL